MWAIQGCEVGLEFTQTDESVSPPLDEELMTRWKTLPLDVVGYHPKIELGDVCKIDQGVLITCLYFWSSSSVTFNNCHTKVPLHCGYVSISAVCKCSKAFSTNPPSCNSMTY